MTAHQLPTLFDSGRTRLVVVLVGIGLSEIALAGAAAWAVATAFDALTAGADRPEVLWRLARFATLLVAVGLAAAWLRGRERLIGERLGQRYVQSIRLVLTDHLFASGPRDLARRSTGAQTLRFTGDLAAVRLWVSLGLARLLVGVPVLVGCLGVIAVLNPAAGLAVAAVIGAGGADLGAVARSLREANRRARRLRGRLAAQTYERVAQAAVVVGFGQQRRERRRLARAGDQLADAMIARARQVGRIRGRAELIRHSASAALLAAGTLTGASSAEVAAGLTVLGFLTSPLRDVARAYEYWQGARVGVERLRAVLSQPTLPVPTLVRDLPEGAGQLVVSDLRVEGVLQGIDLIAEPGTTVVITGANGAGKSTLLAAIARLLVPDTGQVLLDGADLAEVDPAQLRRAVGLVSPDLPLLDGTLWRNVRYRHPRASRGELRRVAAVTGLNELLTTLPDRRRTRVGERGLRLSTGERTRVALARALLGQPRLLLLDEPEARLDAQSRAIIGHAFAGYPGTVVVVTHQPELFAADQVLHLAGGRLVPSATHEVEIEPSTVELE